MYTVDDCDKVVALEGMPQCDIGAPLPVVFSDQRTCIVGYVMRQHAMAGVDDNAFVKFHGCYVHMFGPPNDEAFHGHPLEERGLEPYQAFRIEGSSWGRQLERMNSVHPYHDPADFERLTHYVLGFHDSTFECLAESFSVKVVEGPLRHLLDEIDIFMGEPLY